MGLTGKLDLETSHLSKLYGKTKALQGLNLRIEAGSIYGLIGPNGAGKTTTLAILAGLLRPTSGTAWALGREIKPGCGDLAGAIGFASPQFPLLDYVSGHEILTACGLMHRLSPGEVRKRIADLMELMDLGSAAHQFAGHYSQGMRQKLSLACALIHSPQICLLDEPFLGLDPETAYRLAGILGQMAANGRTILLSSHNMAMLERLCHKVGILHQGSLEREIVLSPAPPEASGNPRHMRAPSALETALWEVVGTPEIKAISWI